MLMPLTPCTTYLKVCLLTTLSCLAMAPALAGDHHAHSTQFSSTPLTDNITLLQGKGGNIAVLSGKQGLLVIDADYHDMSDALQTALTPLGGKEKVSYVINTHWHGDHTQGNYMLGEFATIVAHENVRERLLTPQEVKLFNMKTETYPAHALPSIVYQTKMTLHFNDEAVSIVHLAGGHTDGDSAIIFTKANILHTGDHFFNGFFPFVDIQNGGNVLKMADNVNLMLGMINDETKIIPGHGPLAKKADLQAFETMLRETSAEVSALKKKGMSLADIQKQGLSKKWDSWTKGFLDANTWISIVHSSL